MSVEDPEKMVVQSSKDLPDGKVLVLQYDSKKTRQMMKRKGEVLMWEALDAEE